MSQQSQVRGSRKGMAYGGQALIEGVMMRGRHKVAVAVRNPQGKIIVYEEDLNPTLYRGPISQIPFLRGLTGLWDALGIGLRALIWSAEVAAGMENPKFSGDTDSTLAMTSLSITAGMVFVSPAIASSGLSRLF